MKILQLDFGQQLGLSTFQIWVDPTADNQDLQYQDLTISIKIKEFDYKNDIKKLNDAPRKINIPVEKAIDAL